MAKESSVLRNIFGFFNLLFAISGAAVIVLAIIAHAQISNMQVFQNFGGVILLYVIGFITLGISFLGAYGAFRQVKWMLVTFLVLMCIGFLIMIRLAIVFAVYQNQANRIVEEELRTFSSDKTSEDFQEFMNRIQENYHCCGFFKGYEDWGEQVPPSCDCTSEDVSTEDVCVAMPQNLYQTLLSQRGGSKRMVYSQACGPLAVDLVMKVYVGLMIFFFGLTTVIGLAIVFSSCLIHQINRSRRGAGVVFAPPLIFTTPSQMKYNELVNVPCY